MGRVVGHLRVVAIAAFAAAFPASMAMADNANTGINLALVAQATTSYVSSWETLTAINDGHDPQNSGDYSHGAYGNWPQTGTQWVQYDWTQPIYRRILVG